MRNDILPRRLGWVNEPLVSKWVQEEVHLDRFPWSDGMLWMIWALLGTDAVAQRRRPSGRPSRLKVRNGVPIFAN